MAKNADELSQAEKDHFYEFLVAHTGDFLCSCCGRDKWQIMPVRAHLPSL